MEYLINQVGIERFALIGTDYVQGIDVVDIPVIAFSVGEQELSGIDTAPLVDHLR